MKRIGKGLLVLLLLGCFLLGLTRLEQERQTQGCEQLEEAIRRAAVACYAAEGFYPPDLDYLCRNYGVIYDGQNYYVHYERIASNWMPEITVLEK